ncbi:MAG: LysR family transcriptional regulator [Pseudomonadota bacterium]|nr:LysR family transcriptional regulator [Pseudomonadota bacterium]
MFNKLEALRYFCSAAETLHFSETAQRLSVSPQVVTRVIAELETRLGEQLFKRNTRKVHLTPFAEALLPHAQKLLADSEALFSGSVVRENEMSGLVRIALPPLHDRDEVLFELLQQLVDYPDLKLDWRMDSVQQHWVEEQIDMGIRVNAEPDPRLIVRTLGRFHETIVAAPALLARLGRPESVDDLVRRFPVSNLLNPDSGRLWGWHTGEGQTLMPQQPHFVSNDIYAEIQSALAGRTAAQLPDYLIAAHLQAGRLVRLFPDLPMPQWTLYLYRPHQAVISARVEFVFDALSSILQRRYLNRPAAA